MTPRLPLCVALVASLAACSGIDLSSNSDDPLGESSIVSTVASSALTIGTFAFLTERDRTGAELTDRREISLAIARGNGPFVDDLAAWLELPAGLVPDLGVALRNARPVLEPALSERISVASFEMLIGVALCRDPKLRYHAWKRFQCERLAPFNTLETPPHSPPSDDQNSLTGRTSG